MTSCVEHALRDRRGQVHFFCLPHDGQRSALADGEVWMAEIKALTEDGAELVEYDRRSCVGDPYLGHFLVDPSDPRPLCVVRPGSDEVAA